ncbi:argininosuccinate lyase [Candidatus Portiera aleyrodidarum]|uniref:Argininosuccinate lyase n=1 Tax=Candidatus Portiera aleyrodidarum TaxID=91844 RepID=A0A6S6RR97_9GAMM|nr:argininosuccinate lyase [Candidatus Portiera aleyrodidarum]CAA3709461.1 Argininosuccinate lyase [Candidatus Portiera aleyrodidarum]
MKNFKKPWSGRFKKSTDKLVEKFTASINFDYRLYSHDIKVSIAHAKMLEIVGLLTLKESKLIINGLKNIEKDINNEKINWFIKLEDIHMNIEVNLINKIGNIGKKLHTGRSRNDQISTDIRLYLREKIDKIKLKLTKLRKILINLAISESDTIMPGYTHLQIAQPITFGHHVLAWHEMISRDHLRILECRKRINILPLGSAALAGTTYPINRNIIKDLLGFDHITENSLDAVSDRDFAIEFTSFSSILLMHLSRMCEELILWTSLHFDFIELPDCLCTGSSIMPQKKNPDIPELIRGKTGRIYGNLLNLLVLMKSQPLAYNKDNQEDKEPLFDTTETVINCIDNFINIIKYLKIKPQKMYLSALGNYSTATDFADYLVKRGVPFRDAHSIVGKVVYYGIINKKNFNEIYIEKLREFYNKIDEEILEVLTLEGSINTRNHIGGTAPNQVRSAALRAKKYLKILLG